MKKIYEIKRDVNVSLSELINEVTEDKLESIPDVLQEKKQELIDNLTAFLVDCQQVSINGEDIDYVS